MDPAEVQGVLAAAAFLEIDIGGIRKQLVELSDTEWAFVCKSRDTSAEYKAARKYRKILMMTMELHAALPAVPAATLAFKKKKRPTAAVPLPEPNALALVPYVETRPLFLPVVHPSQAKDPQWGLVITAWLTDWVRAHQRSLACALGGRYPC